MKGIKFNDVHSYDDLNLILAPFQMPPATPKTNFVNIPGGDGSLDMTEALGEVKYNDRTGNFVFSVLPTDDFEEKKTEVSNLLNGLKCRITIEKDPDYYYIGRLTVKSYKANKKLRQITVDYRVQPYKYKQDVTTATFELTKNTQEVTLSNNRKSVVPEIDLISAKHTEQGTSIHVDSGDSTAKVLDFRLFGKSTQDGTPTPDAPVDIVSVADDGSIDVNVCGKNLLNILDYDENNKLVVTATKNDYAYITGYFARLEAGKKYTFSCQCDTDEWGGSTTLDCVECYLLKDKAYNNIKSLQSNPTTFIPEVSGDYYLRVDVNLSGATHSFWNFQIEEGENATAYEPYQEQTITLPHTLCGIPVSSGGNYTDLNSQQWICDEIDLVRGVYVQRIAKEIFDGNQTWEIYSTTGTTNLRFRNATISNKVKSISSANTCAQMICSALPVITANNTYLKTQGISLEVNKSLSVYVDAYAGDIGAWNSYLQNNPMTVCYALATPIETPLEDVSFKLNAPITNILNDEGAEMQLEYSINALVGFDGNTYAISESTHKLLNLCLKQGKNPLSLVGSGQITFKYQEGAL